VSTGFPAADAKDDFARARRTRVLADIGRRLRGEPNDVNLILPFEEVVEALGRVSEHDLGLRSIQLESIVGTVDRTREFDRSFRPTSPRLRTRWERIAAAQRRGESFPPISVFRIGDLHFVRDGHHRTSVARSQGLDSIDAYVTEVRTRVGLGRDLRVTDLPLKGHERLFAERVPLHPERRGQLRLTDPWDYGDLAEAVEAWGMRAMQERHAYLERREVAHLWFEEEYAPVAAHLREGGFIEPSETETDAYMRIACARYELLRTHEWSDAVFEQLRRERTRKTRLPPRRRRKLRL